MAAKVIATPDSPARAHKSSPSSTESADMFNSTMFNESKNTNMLYVSTTRVNGGAGKDKRRSFSPYKFPLRTPEISPIEKQIGELSGKSRSFLTPKAPPDQFVTMRKKDSKRVVKQDFVKHSKKSMSRINSVNEPYYFKVRVSPNTLLTSPLENSDQPFDMSMKSSSGSAQELSSSKVMEKTLCVETILADLSLGKYLDIFIEEEINFQAFLTLDKKDLLEIGITDEKDIETILQTIKSYLNVSIKSPY